MNDLRPAEERARDKVWCSWCGMRFIHRANLYDHWRNNAACRENAIR